MSSLPPPEDNGQCMVCANRRAPLHNSGGTSVSISEGEDWWADWLTFFTLRCSFIHSSLCYDVSNISVWVTALWVMKTKIPGDQMKALAGVVWWELLRFVIRDKNWNVLTLHILIDQISYKLWLWITKMRSLDIILCHHTPRTSLHSLVKLFSNPTWIFSWCWKLQASHSSE